MTKQLHLEAHIKPIGPTRNPPIPHVVVAQTPHDKAIGSSCSNQEGFEAPSRPHDAGEAGEWEWESYPLTKLLWATF
jgi:hypothetical protein